MRENNKPVLTIFLLFLGLLRYDSFPGLEAATRKLAPIPGIYIFGDSLVDAGNNNYLPISIAKANYPHNGVDFPSKKPTGRFCNGKNAADIIAENFGLPLPPPYLSLRGLPKFEKRKSAAVTGVNFASGGAGIFSSYRKFGQTIPFSEQVQQWLSINEELMSQLGQSEAQIHLSKSLFIVAIGSNDILDYFRSSKLQKQNNPQQYTKLMADKFKEQLKIIYNTGARKFLIIGIAKVGCSPKQREKISTVHKCNEETNMWCSLFNEYLIKMLQKFKQELQNSFTYSYFDIFRSINDVISNHAHYGFADVTSACCGNGKLNAELPCHPLAKLCSDRTKYLFWDRYGHPTEAAARTIVDFMLTDDNPQYSFPLSLTQLVYS